MKEVNHALPCCSRSKERGRSFSPPTKHHFTLLIYSNSFVLVYAKNCNNLKVFLEQK